MKIVHYAKQFQKDVKLAKKRGKDLAKLKNVLSLLVAGETLPDKFKDHALKGEFSQYRECHLEPDWLLLYKFTSTDVYFVRVGTHSDLFR